MNSNNGINIGVGSEGEEGVEKCPDCGNLKIPSTERFLQRGKSDIAH